MKIICEVSRPHYHPGPDFKMLVTHKRDLSVPGQWVANERIERGGISYAIVMPPRDKELFEVHQAVHIHIPEYLVIDVNGRKVLAKVKIEKGEFTPRVHFDEADAQTFGITNGDEGQV